MVSVLILCENVKWVPKGCDNCNQCSVIDTRVYTLSHPENDRDVTERAQGYTVQDASFMRQSRCSCLNA